MNKKILLPLALLAVGATAMMFSKRKPNYEGKLLKTIPYNWKSSFISNGKRYEILSGVAWSALNRRVGDLMGKTIEMDIKEVESIPYGGYVSDSGELINA